MTATARPAPLGAAPLLAVADLDRAVGSWSRFGADVAARTGHYVLLRLGGSDLHLAEQGPPPPDRDVALLAPGSGPAASAAVVVRVDDCAAWYERLVADGVSFLGPPVVPSWGGETRAFLRDPDGHLVELNGPETPARGG